MRFVEVAGVARVGHHTGMRMNNWILSMSLAVAVAGSLACGGVGSDDILFAGPPVTVELGESITFTESKSNKEEDASKAKITVTAVDVHAASSREFEKPKRGQFVIVSVEVEVSVGDSDIWPRSFHLVGSDGTVWGDEPGPSGFEPMLDDLTVHQGQRKSGAVLFDADPAKLATGKVELVNWRGKPVGYWTFPGSAAAPSATPSAPPSAPSSMFLPVVPSALP